MSAEQAAQRLQRFLNPRHAAANCAIMQWQGVGEADTPAEDATCRLYLALDAGAEDTAVRAAAFAAFGPPVVIACADWACEWLENNGTGGQIRLSVQTLEQALALVPDERYAALLVLDALADALADAQSNATTG